MPAASNGYSSTLPRSIALIAATFLAAIASPGFSAPDRARGNVFESSVAPVARSPIDPPVFARLAELAITPVLCSDAVFVRRVFLDVTGTLPSAREARDFIRDPDTANKRGRLIDQLLESDAYADFWAMRWADILRIKAEFPVNLWPNAAQAYHRWLRAAIAENQPYDRFARELLTSSGSNFRVGPVNFYRAIQNRTPEGIATVVALTFMGTRAETWPAERRVGMAAFFAQVGYKPTSEWKEEHVFWDPLGASTAPRNTAPGRAAVALIVQPPDTAANAPAVSGVKSPPPTCALFPDGTAVALPPETDPRELFADWLITPDNPWFARCLVNRTWAWLLGRGIIHEPDDIRPDNPPGNPALLAALEREFVASHYDLKALVRLILNSQTYQFSSMPHPSSREADAAFARYPLRRLDAEVLIDAINAVTGTSDLYTSAIPEPFTYIPEGKPAVTIADGSITSPFLALFGRSARATGFASERDNKPVPAQWLHLLNSSHIQRKLEQGPKLRAIVESGRPPAALVEELYLTILSRFPTPEELRNVAALFQVAGPRPAATNPGTANNGTPPGKGIRARRREDWVDLAWALINSTEFLYRH